MAKFLKYLFLIFCLVSFAKKVKAEDSIFYYQRVFSLWGNVSAVVSGEDATKSEKFAYSELTNNLKIYYPVANRRTRTVVISASDYNKLESKRSLNTFSDVFVICNTNLNLSQTVNCDYDTIVTTNDSKMIHLGNGLITNQKLYVYKEHTDTYTIHLIPELLLVTPNYSKAIESYIKAVDTSRVFESKLVDPDSTFVLSTLNIKSIFRNKFAILTINSILVLFSMSVLFFMLNKLGVHKTFRPSKLLVYDLIGEVKGTITRSSRYLKVVLVLALVYWLSFHVIANIQLIKILEFNAVIDNIISVSNPLNISSLSSNFVMSLLAFILLNVIGLLSFILMLPLVLDFILAVIEGVKFPKTTAKVTVMANILLVAAIDFLLVFSDLKANGLIFSSLLVLMYFSLLALRHNNLIANKVKIELLIAILLLPLALVLLKSYYVHSVPSSTAQKLVTIKNQMILLPYSVDVMPNTKFSTYTIEPKNRLFINDYLFFDPGFTQVNVKPIADFISTDNWVVFAFDSTNYLYKINKNTQLLPKLYTQVPTRFISLDLSLLKTPAVKMTMVFDCRIPLGAKKLTVKVLGPESLTGIEKTLFQFPGCSVQNTPVVYNVWLEEPLSSAQYLWELLDYDKLSLTELNFTSATNLNVGFSYLKDPVISYVLAENITNRSTVLNAYSFAVDEMKTFTRTGHTINLASYVNEYIKNYPLSKNIVIWSDASEALLENVSQTR